jgi:peptide/nickel transport system ATP-binding protein
MEALLELRGLKIESISNSKPILDNFSWRIQQGKVYALIGESGSGKTTFAFSLFGMLPKNTKIAFEQFQLFGKSYDYWKKEKWKSIRGKKINMIPQNPHLAFHPYRKIGKQVQEYYSLVLDKNLSEQECCKHWAKFGIRDPERSFQSLPSQVSGGEKQRITIAMAQFSESEIIVADEPTTALDPIQEKNMIELLMNSLKTKNSSIVLITHNLKLMERIADEVMVIKSGKIVEVNSRINGNFPSWKSEYAKQLLGQL